MSWTEKQRKLFLIACGLAGWNDPQRYIAMRACGCPCIVAGGRPRASKPRPDSGPGPETQDPRPSVLSPGNTHEMFAAVMSLAEASARTRGAPMIRFPMPGRGDLSEPRTWRDAALDTADRLRHKAREIWAEAHQRMPGKFKGDEESLDAFVRRQTGGDTRDYPEHFACAPETLDACDAAQACRVVEGLKAWIGRDFFAAGIHPRSFVIPQGAITQVKAQARRNIAKRTSAQEAAR